MALDAGGTSSDPYCKVSLGREKAKTKSISGTINPKWREGFDFYWYEDTGQVGAYYVSHMNLIYLIKVQMCKRMTS